ncbi:LysR family transcriptional regulator [Blastococcus sp. KM273129]|uniref:LysR family transcriptional regulator n=1 Tax=Blastococcus sp. KM273129 TaxID=2570315 RepID=UPI001F3AA078|nr:LysR family transcriptional regulator [Blastococcus sp. KM273129]
MELRQLEHFLAVVEEGSFTRAAARVYMVQSSLSASLLSLERELGTELFVRGHRGAELTDAGRAFLDPARAVLRDVDRAQDAVAEVEGLLRGSVRVATVPLPRELDMSPTISAFREGHPGVDLRLVPAGTQEAVQLVADGEPDFAIAPLPPQVGRTLRFEKLYSTPLVAVCPAGHRLAGARDLDPRELMDEPLIDLARGWWSRALFDRLLEERGLHRDVRLEVTDWHSVVTMAQRGVGIAYGPKACIDLETFAARRSIQPQSCGVGSSRALARSLTTNAPRCPSGPHAGTTTTQAAFPVGERPGQGVGAWRKANPQVHAHEWR